MLWKLYLREAGPWRGWRKYDSKRGGILPGPQFLGYKQQGRGEEVPVQGALSLLLLPHGTDF